MTSPAVSATSIGLARCESGQFGCCAATAAAIAVKMNPLVSGQRFGRRLMTNHASKQAAADPRIAQITSWGTASGRECPRKHAAVVKRDFAEHGSGLRRFVHELPSARREQQIRLVALGGGGMSIRRVSRWAA